MIHLRLPLPPSPNDRPSHHMALHRAKNKYRRTCWIHAIGQHKPPRNPPEHVRLSAIFFVHNERDEVDNLGASLKWVLDALKQEQTGKLHWRQGVADRCGYFVDDDPKHLSRGKIRQVVDREEPRLELILDWEDETRHYRQEAG